MAVLLVMVVAESVHGALRNALLAPVVGDIRARQLSVATGSILILLIATASIRWIGASSRRSLIGIGGLWVSLMLAFEVGVGRWVARLSWDRILSDYDLVRGGMLGIGMLILAAAPLIAAGIRRLPAGS
ncbi:MAG TPA: hypothetical protein VEI47_04610 [Gemmatimonadales bacterium]|nr:hypothetical protein [Gemmatimonadales bacterium]